jgi:hypothetical protein
MGRRIEESTVLHHGSRLGEPSRIPERADFPFRLVPGTSPAIEAIEGRSLEEQCSHHDADVLKYKEGSIQMDSIAVAAPTYREDEEAGSKHQEGYQIPQ